MKKRKIMMSVLSAALVGVVAIGGTLAYLSDKSNTVTNTFNVGSGYEEDDDDHIGLWLDETAKPKDGGNPVDPSKTDRTEDGVVYDEMLPGSIVAKDPTFHLTDGSVNSYVFAFVDGVDAMIEDGYIFAVDKPAALVDPDQSVFNDEWVKLPADSEGFDGWYVYKMDAAGETEAEMYGVNGGEEMVPMFQYVKLGSDLENAEFDAVAEMSQLTIFGVAVQTANLTMDEALTEAGRVIDEAAGVAPIEG